MRQYELTYLISDEIRESDINKVTGKVGGYISDCDGKIKKEEIWGRRKLVYPIYKQNFATYVTINFEVPSEKIKEFEHNIKLTGKIVRHLLLVKDFGIEEELILTQEDIAEAKDLEKVAGGEKSFEALKEETKKSKELMAKRRESAISAESATDTSVSKQKEEGIPKSTSKQEIKEKKTQVEKKALMPQSKIEKTGSRSGSVGKITKEKPSKSKKETPEKLKKEERESTEADRLSKLNEELEDILSDEL